MFDPQPLFRRVGAITRFELGISHGAAGNTILQTTDRAIRAAAASGEQAYDQLHDLSICVGTARDYETWAGQMGVRRAGGLEAMCCPISERAEKLAGAGDAELHGATRGRQLVVPDRPNARALTRNVRSGGCQAGAGMTFKPGPRSGRRDRWLAGHCRPATLLNTCARKHGAAPTGGLRRERAKPMVATRGDTPVLRLVLPDGPARRQEASTRLAGGEVRRAMAPAKRALSAGGDRMRRTYCRFSGIVRRVDRPLKSGCRGAPMPCPASARTFRIIAGHYQRRWRSMAPLTSCARTGSRTDRGGRNAFTREEGRGRSDTNAISSPRRRSSISARGIEAPDIEVLMIRLFIRLRLRRSFSSRPTGTDLRYSRVPATARLRSRGRVCYAYVRSGWSAGLPSTAGYLNDGSAISTLCAT